MSTSAIQYDVPTGKILIMLTEMVVANIDVFSLGGTVKQLDSLTPKSVPAGTKNSRSEGFWLAKHKDTNIPTMMEPFSSPAAWF